jgi:hypothetical protein
MHRRSSTRAAARPAGHVVWLERGERTEMLTENIRRDGMLLRWEESSARLPHVVEMLIVEAELPEQEGFERRCIRCQTTVARVHADPGATFTWVGLRIHGMDFRVAQEAPAHREPAAYNGRGTDICVHSTNLESLLVLAGVFAFLEFFFFQLALLVVFVLWLGRKVLHEFVSIRSEWRSANILGSTKQLAQNRGREPSSP